MHVLVIGATGGSGRAVVRELLDRGHDVTAVSRHATGLDDQPRLRRVDADATVEGELAPLVTDADAVVVCLGITENPLRVRLRGAANTPDDVRSRGTQVVVDAVQQSQAADGRTRRLVVQTSFGVGPSREHLPLAARIFFAVLLKPQIADTERQEQVVRGSGLEWVLVQPVNLSDDDEPGALHVSTEPETIGMSVGRGQVATVLADAVEGEHPTGATLAVSTGKGD